MTGLNVFSVSRFKLYSKLYETYYQLNACPFPLTADNKICFPHRTYKKNKKLLEYALSRAEGFIVITGISGIGKTTLINEHLEKLGREKLLIGVLDGSQISTDDVLRRVANSFGLNNGQDKSTLLSKLKRFIMEQSRIGKRALLIVDNGESLSAATMEEIRLLSISHVNGTPLMQVVLVGLDQLWKSVRSPGMEQLHQRLLAACQLAPLDIKETKQYIIHCLRASSWKENPLLVDDLFPLLYKLSQGIPRRINILCSWLLYFGYINELRILGLSEAQRAINELGHVQLMFFKELMHQSSAKQKVLLS
jgi:type II secretory pathway predicted ATPase ExeA